MGIIYGSQWLEVNNYRITYISTCRQDNNDYSIAILVVEVYSLCRLSTELSGLQSSATWQQAGHSKRQPSDRKKTICEVSQWPILRIQWLMQVQKLRTQRTNPKFTISWNCVAILYNSVESVDKQFSYPLPVFGPHLGYSTFRVPHSNRKHRFRKHRWCSRRNSVVILHIQAEIRAHRHNCYVEPAILKFLANMSTDKRINFAPICIADIYLDKSPGHIGMLGPASFTKLLEMSA